MSLALLLIMLVFFPGCAPSRLAPLTGTSIDFQDDERRLWKRAAEEEKILDQSGLILRNGGLEGYLESVAVKLAPPDMTKALPVKVRVIRNPYLNAFAFPDGVIYIHTGLLARIDNEAQLSVVLGHELSHVIRRHMILDLRNTKKKTAVGASLAGLVGVPIGALTAVAAITGYSRELESEADAEGIDRAVAAGYAPGEAATLIRRLQEGYEEDEINEPFFFGTHPLLTERLKNINALLENKYVGKGGEIGRDTYLREIAPVMLDNARLDIRMGRMSVARRSLKRFVGLWPDNAQAYFLLGETHRQKDEKGNLEKSAEYYLKAMSLDPSYPEPHRSLGMVAYRQKNVPLANRSLQRYLELATDASDREYIEQMLRDFK